MNSKEDIFIYAYTHTEKIKVEALGGMEGAWDLWNCGICPSILSNCGSWVKLTKKALG